MPGCCSYLDLLFTFFLLFYLHFTAKDRQMIFFLSNEMSKTDSASYLHEVRDVRTFCCNTPNANHSLVNATASVCEGVSDDTVQGLDHTKTFALFCFKTEILKNMFSKTFPSKHVSFICFLYSYVNG